MIGEGKEDLCARGGRPEAGCWRGPLMQQWLDSMDWLTSQLVCACSLEPNLLGCERTTSVSEQRDEARNIVQTVRAGDGVCDASRFLFLFLLF